MVQRQHRYRSWSTCVRVIVLALAGSGSAHASLDSAKPQSQSAQVSAFDIVAGGELLAERHRSFDQVLIPLDRIDRRADAEASAQLLGGEVHQRLERLPMQSSAASAWNQYQADFILSGLKTEFACFGDDECGAAFGIFVALSGRIVPAEFGPVSSLDNGAALVGSKNVGALTRYVFIHIQPQGDGVVDVFQQQVEIVPPSAAPDQAPPWPSARAVARLPLTSAGTAGRSLEITFRHASTIIDESEKHVLADIARLFIRFPQSRFDLVGHSDITEELSADTALSLRRAQAVAAALNENFRIDAQRLSAYGRGAAEPMGSGSTEQGRARNRRVVVVAGAEGDM